MRLWGASTWVVVGLFTMAWIIWSLVSRETLMKKSFKSLAAVGVMTATLLSLTSCSVVKEVMTNRDNVTSQSGVLLPKPWREATVTWTEKGTISQVTSLPKNIAYVSKRPEGAEFLMYSPEGKAIVKIGTAKELPNVKFMDVRQVFVNGKTYLQVIQSQGNNFVATGLDEDGKQLFRRVELDNRLKVIPVLDPKTGKNVEKSRDSVSGTRSSKVYKTIDGVEVKSVTDRASGKRFIAGPGWEREVHVTGPRQTNVNPVGRYLCITESTVSSKEYQLLDVHTGKEVQSNRVVSSCSVNENGVTDGNSVIHRSDALLNLLAARYGLNGNSGAGDNGSYVAVPGQSAGWSYPRNCCNFLPYSYDPAGRVYGYIVNGDELESGAMDASDPKTLIRLNGNPVAPIAVTGSGIGVFPAPTVENLVIGMNNGSSVTDTVFAVKKAPVA